LNPKLQQVIQIMKTQILA